MIVAERLGHTLHSVQNAVAVDSYALGVVIWPWPFDPPWPTTPPAMERNLSDSA